jgi:hypothetical protein
MIFFPFPWNVTICNPPTNFVLKILNFLSQLPIHPQYFQEFLGNFLILPNFPPKILPSLRAGEATNSFDSHFFLDVLFSYFF